MKGEIDSRKAGNFKTEKEKYIYPYQNESNLYVYNKTKQAQTERSPLSLFLKQSSRSREVVLVKSVLGKLGL